MLPSVGPHPQGALAIAQPQQPLPTRTLFARFQAWLQPILQRGVVPGGSLTIVLAAIVGLLAGFGAAIFGYLIEAVTELTYGAANAARSDGGWLWAIGLVVSPALAMLGVAWATRVFAPEAQGHGVPEVITAVARHDGVIRPRIALVKILASGFTIGAGGSVGREGPIVQIGSALGSTAGQMFKLSAKNIKVLVAAGAAAGISATFNAPLAGVIFASEIILGTFAVESLTPIVLASVIADVVQQHVGEHRLDPAFKDLEYQFAGAWLQLPSYLLLGLVAGLVAAGFIKMLYGVEDLTHRLLPSWWRRAFVLGGIVGLFGVFYPAAPPYLSREASQHEHAQLPPLMGVGYGVVEHSLHLTIDTPKPPPDSETEPSHEALISDLKSLGSLFRTSPDKAVKLPTDGMLAELLWLAPLVLLKPLMTSLTLAGGGSGGVFAPSLFLGATLGATFGVVMNLLLPEYCHSPGVYAIVGMAAVVAGATQGVLSAILIVYEMTDQYEIILPIMAAVGVASIVTRIVDPESIYYRSSADAASASRAGTTCSISTT